jgi:hypothetical protein
LCGGGGLRNVFAPTSLTDTAQATILIPLAGGFYVAITERRIMRINVGKWEEVIEMEREFQKIESEVGITSKKRWLRTMAGPLGLMTLVWERDWESVEESEKAYARLIPEALKANLKNRFEECVAEMHNEYYQIVEV